MIQISIGRYECAFNVDCLQYYICVPFHCPVPMTVTGCNPQIFVNASHVTLKCHTVTVSAKALSVHSLHIFIGQCRVLPCPHSIH